MKIIRGNSLKVWRSQHFCVLVASALVIYLFSPALFPTHFEGISAMTEVAAMLPRATFLGSSITPPLVAEFVIASRPLMVGLIRAVASVTGDIGTGFGALITLAFCVFVAASCMVARRLTGLPWSLLLLGFASFPGLTSLGYSLNDNIVAGAFAMSALAAVAYSPRGSGCLGGGVLLGIATCVRPDSLLLAPAIALMAWQEELTWRDLMARAVCGSAGFITVLLALPLLSGISAVDMLTYVLFFARDVPSAHHVVAALNAADAPVTGSVAIAKTTGLGTKLLGASTNTLLFLGPAGLALAAISAAIAVRRVWHWRNVKLDGPAIRRVLLVYAYPLVIFAYAFRYAIVIRYFFLFSAPFILAMAASAIGWLASQCRHGGFKQGAGVAAIAVVSLALPPVQPRSPSGPEVFAGLLWGPKVWRRYENEMRSGMARLTADLAKRNGGETTVVAYGWTEASFSLLAGLRAGYLPAPASDCPSTVAHLVAPDGAKVMIVSAFDPWDQTLMLYRRNSAAQIDAATSCYPQPPQHLVRAYLGMDTRHQPPAISTWDTSIPHSPIQPFALPDQLPLLLFGSGEIDPALWMQIAETGRAQLRGESSGRLIAIIRSRLGSRLDIPLAKRQP